MSDLPTGTVTFLFTDLEGSTRLWEQYPDAMKEALAFHDAILRDAVRVHGGHIVKMTGDGVHAAFSDAARALLAAADAQRVLNEHAWGDVVLRVRMGVHTGHAEARDGDYYGTSVNRAARLMSAANGGQVVVSLAAEELACDELPPDVSLIDLGEQRLRDLARSERMFQLSAPGLAATFPALRSLDAYPSNLPPQVTSFVGREAALCDVAEALQSSRIVSLTGVGGVGKTRLATQVAAEVLPEFADGVWLCELAAAGDAESMTQLVAATLGVSPRPGITLESSVADFLHLKRVLLVLDNCEHLLEAAAHLVDVIVQRCPDARVLITSREGLGVPGEQIWPVRSLVVEGTSGAANDAMMLFADRARAARPGFALDQTNEQAVRDVCRRLDGIPLAIELAAARVTAMSPADIAGLLDERFRLLTGGRRTAVERHQTLRAAVDWSYSLLTPTERTVFDCLGVFAGTFDADSASAVAIGKGIERWDVLDAVSSLVAKSMAVMEEDDDSTRYQLLETLRQYARERLDEAGVADDVRRRHATHYCERAEALGPALHGAGEIAARRQIRADLDDLRAAVFWAADSGTDGELAIRVIASVGIEQTQDQRAGIGAWAIRVADLARQSSPGLRMAALSVAAAQFMMLGDYAAARSFAQDAIVEPLPSDCPVPYSPYYVLQSLEAYEGRPEAAFRLAYRTRELLEAEGADAFSIALQYGLASAWAFAAGDSAAARVNAEEALRRGRALQNPSLISTALFGLAWGVADDEPDRALDLLEENIELIRSGSGDATYPSSLLEAAVFYLRRGERSRALPHLFESLVFSLHHGQPLQVLGDLHWEVEILGRIGEYELAAVAYGIVRLGPLEAATTYFARYFSSPDWLAVIERTKDALGDRFDSLAERGAAMSYDDVVAWLREVLDRLESEASDE